MYELTNFDMAPVGGPMHSAYPKERWTKHFSSLEKAMKYAEKEYGSEIEWSGTKDGVSSGDLRHTLYKVRLLEVEE